MGVCCYCSGNPDKGADKGTAVHTRQSNKKCPEMFLKTGISAHTLSEPQNGERQAGERRWRVLDDRTLVNTGMAYSEKTMEVADNLVQALLAALSGKSAPGQQRILEQFAAYERSGGGLQVIQFDAARLGSFKKEAGKAGLVFYAVTDTRTGQAAVMTRDRDARLLEKVEEGLASRGMPLYPDPQVSVAEFLDRHDRKELVFVRTESLEQVEAAKAGAAGRGIRFAIGRQPDSRYMVIFCKKDREALGKLGIVDSSREPESLFSVWDIGEVKETDRKERQVMENERQKQKDHGRSR